MMSGSPPAQAQTAQGARTVQGIDLSRVAPIKQPAFLSAQDFESKTFLQSEEAPYDDALLSYELRLPQGWQAQTTQSPVAAVPPRAAAGASDTITGRGIGLNILTPIARYTGPPVDFRRSYIVVESQQLGYEISARDWFVNFILENGFTLSALSEREDGSIEAIYIQVERGGDTYGVRVRVLVNGSRLLLVRYYLPQENYAQEMPLQAQVLDSFRLKNPSDRGIEERATYAFLDQSYVDYPLSWQLNASPIYSIERMNLSLSHHQSSDDSSFLEGQIRVRVVSKLLGTRLSQEVQSFRDDLDVRGYAIGAMIENLSYRYDGSILSGRAQAYRLTPENPSGMKAYELAVAAMEGTDFYYITSLVTPSREQDFRSWARNMEAFRIINQSLRRAEAPQG